MTTVNKDTLSTIGAVGRPAVEYVGVEDIPLHPIEALHLIDYDQVLESMRAGKVAVFKVAADLIEEFAEWVRAMFNADLEQRRHFVELRYERESQRLFMWSSEFSPWPFLIPDLYAGEEPGHPRDVRVILGVEVVE